MTPLCEEISYCRGCGYTDFEEIFSLGPQAISDFYAEVPENEPKIPLDLVRCTRCNLVQLTHSVDKERLYRSYYYRSSGNEEMVRALEDIVRSAFSNACLKEGDTVLDIGANDGTLLNNYPSFLKTIGFEPSNLAKEVSARHLMSPDFYPPKTPMAWPRSLRCKVITSIAMFYDLDDSYHFFQRIAQDLLPEGVWINQMMDLAAMLAANAFDNICHEHVAYWDEENFREAAAEHDLACKEVVRNSVNGGSIRHVMHKSSAGHARAKLDWANSWKVFKKNVQAQRDALLAFLEECRQNGKVVLGYGASTKGNTLLQYYQIDSNLLPAIAERNPAKWSKVTAGTHIPIISEDEMRDLKPDYLLALPWAFIDSFKRRERELLAEGTKFVVPLPEFKVV